MSARAIFEGLRADGQKLQELTTSVLGADGEGSRELLALTKIIDDINARSNQLRREIEAGATCEAVLMSDQESSSKLSHGVSIRSRSGEAAEVVIVVQAGDSDFDEPALLAKAWAQLADAINAHKQNTSEPQSRPEEPMASPDAPTTPGSGAWWNG
ncbi:hypothetical protein [Mesorhizobium sp. CA4]|uniref:hypothetical protein n=1 Tax=Mesorhizobium sp. CA4 TaxID=588499 RepID=UPI001CD04FA6|nr:hypothetical protein [Mesorhizobium sp. CA4]MBZ9822169.1 hypothetical protein [Mesorhizobium sp. CA4]